MSRFNVKALLKAKGTPKEQEVGEVERDTILFVCTGNIARSASAQLIAQHRDWNDGWKFDSAGVGAVVDAPVAPHIDYELESRGIDISGYKAKQITRELVDSAALIIAMDSSHRKWLIREWPDLHRRVLLLKQIQRVRPSAGRRMDPISYLTQVDLDPVLQDDIADPYRRGPVAAKRAVEEVEDGLDVLLPWLNNR